MKKIIPILPILGFLLSCNFSIFSPETELKYDMSFQLKMDSLTCSSIPFLHGKVVDTETGEPAILANVAVLIGYDLVTGIQTDFDGCFKITNIDIGSYTVEASYVGYRTNRATNVNIEAGKSTELIFFQKVKTDIDIELTCGGGYPTPLIKQDETTSGHTFDADFIKRMAW